MKKLFLLVLLSFFQQITYAEENNGSILLKEDAELKIINKIANESFEYPHYQVGTEFLSGKILPRNFEKAIFWLAQSSEVEEYNKADYLLAEIYAKGLLKPEYRNIKKAMFFYERSANRGNEDAKLKSAVNFLYNDEVLDKEKGLYWLDKSMKSGNLTAYQLYNALILTDEDSPTVFKQLDYISERSDKGDNLSSFYLGLIYLKNNIVKRDLNQSKKYFIKSMNQGNLIAEEFLLQIDKIKNSNEKENGLK